MKCILCPVSFEGEQFHNVYCINDQETRRTSGTHQGLDWFSQACIQVGVSSTSYWDSIFIILLLTYDYTKHKCKACTFSCMTEVKLSLARHASWSESAVLLRKC